VSNRGRGRQTLLPAANVSRGKLNVFRSGAGINDSIFGAGRGPQSEFRSIRNRTRRLQELSTGVNRCFRSFGNEARRIRNRSSIHQERALATFQERLADT
jgi:hypothetical protein